MLLETLSTGQLRLPSRGLFMKKVPGSSKTIYFGALRLGLGFRV